MLAKISLVKVLAVVYTAPTSLALLAMHEKEGEIMKDKKKEGPGKPRNVVYITLNEQMRRQLEEERERRGGDEAGVKLAPIAREKLARQLESERRKK